MTSPGATGRKLASTSRSPRPPSGCRSPPFFALVVLYFVGMDQGATSVFGEQHVRPRVRARRPSPARLPLPLTQSRQPTQWKSRSSGAACWPAPSLACLHSSSPGSSSSPSSTAPSAIEDGTARPTRRMETRGGRTTTVEAVRAVHPRRPGQHRHGLRRTGVQRRDGRVVRGGVRRGIRPGRQRLGRACCRC